ncbi:MAG: hypothetical protein ABIS28_13865 [Caldimonas sp.]
MKHASINTLVAVLLMATASTVKADDGQPLANGNVSQPAQRARGQFATAGHVLRGTATPSVAGERRRNALNVHRVRDAGHLPGRTSHSAYGQRWKWSANQVPETLVTPL